jgi:hypothetical protein
LMLYNIEHWSISADSQFFRPSLLHFIPPPHKS